MSNDRLKYLLERYELDLASPEETKELFLWIRKLKDGNLLQEKIKKLWSDNRMEASAAEPDWSAIYHKIVETPVIGQKRSWLKVAAAAVILMVLGAGTYLLFRSGGGKPVAAVEKLSPAAVLLPGSDRAVLTLAGGEQIILDSADNGTLTQQGNTKIIKLDDGRLSYSSLSGKQGDVLYNTISTPRGGQYQLVLADGTKVWLNAASSLRFPASFTEEKRRVELTGEGYFEVAHNAEQPFIVEVNGAEIQVLGTHFNVNAYDDEDALKTTLLEGSVRINKSGVNKVIRPGEQAQISNVNGPVTGEIAVREVDVNAVTAWKDGRFIFKGDDIHSVMRQLARWYDAEVSYEENLTSEEFVGVINRSRYDNIADILEMLEKTGAVNFEVQEKSITVMPYKSKATH